jgi:hypothetical protein
MGTACPRLVGWNLKRSESVRALMRARFNSAGWDFVRGGIRGS